MHKSTPQALAGMVLNSQNTRASVLLWWWLCAEETLPTLRHGPPKAVDPAASASTTAPDFCCNPLRLSLLHFESAQLSEFLIPPSPLCLIIPFTLPPAVDRIHPFCLPYTLFSVPLFDSLLAPNISRFFFPPLIVWLETWDPALFFFLFLTSLLSLPFSSTPVCSLIREAEAFWGYCIRGSKADPTSFSFIFAFSALVSIIDGQSLQLSSLIGSGDLTGTCVDM